MKNIIITACDEKYGDFLINHWLRSLKDNVDLTNIDIAVIDYGLSKKQTEALEKEEIILIKKRKKEHIVIQRLKDISYFLKNRLYDQVLMCDSGDIIFQKDIKELFEKNKEDIKVSFDSSNIFFQVYLNPIYFNKKILKELMKLNLKKRMINLGLIVGPKEKIQKLLKKSYRIIKNKKNYGPDQIAINYFLRKEGFKIIDEKYNFIPLATEKKFYVKNSKFYDENFKLIPVVHNAGKSNLFRLIENFGYGKGRNNVKKFYLITKTYNRIIKKIFTEKN